jgi:hypothetical protein
MAKGKMGRGRNDKERNGTKFGAKWERAKREGAKWEVTFKIMQLSQTVNPNMIFKKKTLGLYLYHSNGFCDVLTGRLHQFPLSIDRWASGKILLHTCIHTCSMADKRRRSQAHHRVCNSSLPPLIILIITKTKFLNNLSIQCIFN